jgi:heat shock protein HslJ
MMKTILLSLGCLLLFSSCALFPIQSELDGTRWLLQSLREQPLLADTAITAKFSQDGISGTSGCNFYGAKISFSPVKRLKIVEVANTEMYCEARSGLMEQEELYLQTLAAATSYRLEDDNLVLMDRAGDILLNFRLLPSFENNPELLFGKTWELIDAEGIKAHDLAGFSLQFEEDRFRGTTQCRDYEGSYQSAGDGIRIFTLSMLGEVNCSQAELIAEVTYTSLLEMVDQYQVTPDRLELYTVKYDKLIFEWLPAE